MANGNANNLAWQIMRSFLLKISVEFAFLFLILGYASSYKTGHRTEVLVLTDPKHLNCRPHL